MTNERIFKGPALPIGWDAGPWIDRCRALAFTGTGGSCNWGQDIAPRYAKRPCPSCAEEREQWQQARNTGNFYQQPHHPECPRCGIAESKVAYANPRDPGKAYHKQCAGFDPATERPWTEADRREHFARRYANDQYEIVMGGTNWVKTPETADIGASKPEHLTDEQIEAAADGEYPDDAITGLSDRHIFIHAAKWARGKLGGVVRKPEALTDDMIIRKTESWADPEFADGFDTGARWARRYYEGDDLATPTQQREAVKGEQDGEAFAATLHGDLVLVRYGDDHTLRIDAAILAQPVLEWDAQRGEGGHVGGDATCESCPAWTATADGEGVGHCRGDVPSVYVGAEGPVSLMPRTSRNHWCMRHPRRKLQSE